MVKDIYTLPELSFVGGQSQEIDFCLSDDDGNPFLVSDGSADFSICHYSNKSGTPILSITPTVTEEGSGTDVYTNIHVSIQPSDTVNLHGKYVYQITIFDDSGNVSIPNHGIMNITKNINTAIINSGDDDE